MTGPVEAEASPSAARIGFPLPGVADLSVRVLDSLRGADDPKSARALVVRELQAAKSQAAAAFETAFRDDPRHARALIAAQAGLTDVLVQVTLAAALPRWPRG